MVAAPPEGGETPLLVTVTGNTVAVQLSKMTLREPNMLTTFRHNQTLRNAIIRCGLINVVNDGKPPSRETVIGMNPGLTAEEIDDKLYEAMVQYQEENAKLFDAVYLSIDLKTDWEILDSEWISDNFVKGAVRDGNGLMQWAASFHDPKSDAIQKRLRTELEAFKLPIETNQASLLKTLLDMLSIWGRITGNDKTSHVSLNAYYIIVRDKMPTSPAEKPIPRLRAMLADRIYQESDSLRDVGRIIRDMVRFASAHGVPEFSTRAAYAIPGGSPAGPPGAKQNDCTRCEVYDCTAGNDVNKCASFNTRVDIKGMRPMAQRFIEGGRTYIKSHPTCKSLKGMRLELPPFKNSTSSGNPGRSGGRGTPYGRGGARGATAAAIFTVDTMLGEKPAEIDDEQCNECSFDEWLLENQGAQDIVAPVMPKFFANLFTQDDDNDNNLTQQELLEEASRQADEKIRMYNTPQVPRREENPALAQLTPRSSSKTPVVNTSLDELRQASAASGGGNGKNTDSDSNNNSKNNASAVESMYEAQIATSKVGLKLAKDARKNDEKQKKRTTIVKALNTLAYSAANLIKKGLDKLNWVQLGLLIVVNYYMIWPNIKPTARNLLARLYRYLLGMTRNTRDLVLGAIAERATGAMATGAVIAATSAVQRLNSLNNEPATLDTEQVVDNGPFRQIVGDDNDAGNNTPAAAAAATTALSPIREESTPTSNAPSKLTVVDARPGHDTAVHEPPAPMLRGETITVKSERQGVVMADTHSAEPFIKDEEQEAPTTTDLVLTQEDLNGKVGTMGNSKFVLMISKTVDNQLMPPPMARSVQVTTDASAASQESHKLTGLSSTLSSPDGLDVTTDTSTDNQEPHKLAALSSTLNSPDGQQSTSSNATLLDCVYGPDCVCDAKSKYICPPCTDDAEESALSAPVNLDKERGGDCSECRRPQDALEHCLVCGQVLCHKCLPQGMHAYCHAAGETVQPANANSGNQPNWRKNHDGPCVYNAFNCISCEESTGQSVPIALGGNANEVVISPNMADRERSGPCSECLIPQDSRTPCLHCDQLLCEKCLPQELHGYCADTLLPLENKRTDSTYPASLFPIAPSIAPSVLAPLGHGLGPSPPTWEKPRCTKCVANGDPSGEKIAMYFKCNGGRSQCEIRCCCMDPRLDGVSVCNGCTEKFCTVHARMHRVNEVIDIDDYSGHACDRHALVSNANVTAHNKSHDRMAVPAVQRVTNNMRCLGDAVMTSPNSIPLSATLLDNGASVHCAKTLQGALLQTFEPEEPGDGISVGDENAALVSQGSYLYAIEYTDTLGSKVQMLIRMLHCPNVICDIISESKLVYEEHCTITFTGTNGRVITLLNGKQMRLTMTANGLGWLKAQPITDDKTVLQLLDANNNRKVVASVPRFSPSGSVMHDRLSDAQMRAIAHTNGVSEDAIDSYVKAWVMSLAEQGDKAGTYIEQDGIEPDPNQVEAGPSDMLIDNIATSTGMYYMLDPVLIKCTAHEPIAINAELVALTGIQVINAPIDIKLTADNNYNYLGYSHDDVSATAALTCAHAYSKLVSISARRMEDLSMASYHLAVCKQNVENIRKDIPSHILNLFTKPEPKEWNSPPLMNMCETAEECADRIANFHMAMQRQGTKYTLPSDEVTTCNSEPRMHELVHQMRRLSCDGEALVLRAYNKEIAKHKYTEKQLLDMKMQRNIIEAARHKRAHFNLNQVTPLCMDNAAATKLVLAATGPTKPLSAPPQGIGFGRPPNLTGLEILRRTHCALGHPSLDQVLETLAKTKNMRAGIITREDVEAFRKEGCGLCTIWLMRQSPVKPLVDPTRAPIGKKWSFDTMHLKVASPEGFMYITRFYDDGSHFKKSYGHSGMDTPTFQKLMGQLRAFARPDHGEIWIAKRDGLPALAARAMRDCMAENQVIDQVTAPHRHQSMPVEGTWSHDVPRTMAMLQQGPGPKALRHFYAAFLCQERASNRTVKPRQHEKEALSATMLFYGNDHSQINLLFIFFAPVFYLVHPEIRNSKFHEHAKPAAYYGPSRDTDSERYCLLWDGKRSFTCDIGCMRIDESQQLARMSKTNADLQPWTLDPDDKPEMPNFDQWTTPSLTNTTGGQNEPEIVVQELDLDIVPGDPDPVTPFIMFVGAGMRRIGEVGHWVKRITSSKVRVVSIDPKRRGYAHNVLIPRVRDWVNHLAALVICIAIIISIPCSPWAPQKLNVINGGPKVLFNALNPNGVMLSSGNIDPVAAGALQLAEVVFNLARKVDAHGGKVLTETPVNHGKNSMWPIVGREEHSTLYDTDVFKAFASDVPGDIVYSDQCMTGASTRKTTQWYCNLRALPKALKYLGELICPGKNGGHDHNATSLVGKKDDGKWRSEGSDEYTPNQCGRLAHIVLEDDDGVSTPAATSVEPAGGGGEHTPTNHTPPGSDELGPSPQNEDDDDDSDPDDPNLPDAPFEALKETLISNQEAAAARQSDQLDRPQEAPTFPSTPIVPIPATPIVPIPSTPIVPSTISDAPEPEDPYPVGTNVDVYWTEDKTWFNGTVIDSHVTKKSKNDNNGSIRNIQVRYPDGDFTHSLHNNQVRESTSKVDVPQEVANVPSSTAATTSSASPVLPLSEAAPVAAAPDTSIVTGLPNWMPSEYRNAKDKSPSFVHQGEKVVALPEVTPTDSDLIGYEPFVATCPRFYQKIKHWSKTLHADWLRSMTMQQAMDLITKSKANNEIGKGNDGYDEAIGSQWFSQMPYLEQYVRELSGITEVDEQANLGDLGTQQAITAMISNTKQNMSRAGSNERYAQCMEAMETAIAHNTDAFSVISCLYDFEDDVMFTCNVITAIVNGVEMIIDPSEPQNWHTPKNEREYLRSPQRAQWRTAREKKMDQYMDLNVFKLVRRAGINPKRIMGSLWANKIKFNEQGEFCSLNPRWCVKGFGMDKSIYTGFSEVCLTTTIKMMACIRACYKVKDFLFDASNAFQATRTDDGTVSSEKLYCDQAPGFNVKDTDGAPMVCEILVALQGRVDAARLFGQRLEQILFKLGARRSTWDPKAYFFHFGPLTDTAATLDEVLAACAKVEKGNDKHGRPNGWAVLAVHVDDCPGIASSERMINYIKAGIETQYKVTHAPWKKVLGFKFECTDTTVTMSAEHTIEVMYKTFLQGQLKYDARMPGRDIKLTNGEAPAAGDPRLTAYLEMQSETRSLLGLLLWVSLAYPQISYQVNRACGFMSNPSHEVNAYAKHIAMHLHQYPTPVTWGGATSLELSQPTVTPFTDGAKEFGLHFAADASPDDAARGITGGVGMLGGGAVLTVSTRQHLATPDMHANEVLAAGTIMHKVVPLRGFLTEARIPQEHGTPLYIDSASTVFVAQSRGAVKKSAWIRRRSEVLTEAFDMGECDPRKIEEFNNFSDPQTKYLVYRVWARHLHYTHNLPGDPPPPVEKTTKKGPSTSGVLVNMTKKNLLLAMGL